MNFKDILKRRKTATAEELEGALDTLQGKFELAQKELQEKEERLRLARLAVALDPSDDTVTARRAEHDRAIDTVQGLEMAMEELTGNLEQARERERTARLKDIDREIESLFRQQAKGEEEITKELARISDLLWRFRGIPRGQLINQFQALDLLAMQHSKTFLDACNGHAALKKTPVAGKIADLRQEAQDIRWQAGQV